ncbi:CNNM domain-containing protein [Candidatus Sororendozoicomonas aggregata]|uniref:CNNM domain-containing protein n=1 Tax=Candidatus Sororendozoicomonas aggregata TaxID=3073239 RepID=UPI002ED4C5FB
MLLVVVVVSIIALTGLLSMVESAIICVDELRLARILRKKPSHQKDIKYIIRNKSEHLSSIVLLTTLISIAGSSSVGALASQRLDSFELAIFTGLLTYCMLVFAKMLPKLVAVQIADQVLTHGAPTIRIFCRLLTPVLWCILLWARLLPKKRRERITRDDLRSIIKYYKKNGAIAPEESVIAEHALNIHSRKLTDLLSDRGPMIWLPADATIDSVYEKVRKSNFKRYIVISKGKATGIVLYRHLARAVINGDQDRKIGELARQAIFLAPETTLLEALEQFRENRASVAILPGDSPEENKFVTVKQIYRAVLHKSAY